MILCKLAMQLNCFLPNSTLYYDSQTQLIQLEAWPNMLLQSSELVQCKQLNNYQFQTLVKIARSTFQSTVTQFSYNQSISLQLSCITGDSKCERAYIKQYTVASYSLKFLAVNITLQGAAGYFRIRKFDHNNCFTNVKMEFSLQNAIEQIDATMQPNACSTSVNTNQIIYQLTQNDIVKFEKVFTFEQLGLNFLTDKINYTNQISQISLLCLSDILCINTIDLLLDSPFPNINVVLITQSLNKGIVQNQTINTDFSIFKHKLTESCFSQISLSLHTSLIKANFKPNSATFCSKAYFKSLFSFNNIIVETGVQTPSGQFVYDVQDDNFPFMTNYSLIFNCNNQGTQIQQMDPTFCKQQIEILQTDVQNAVKMTKSITFEFKDSDKIQEKLYFVPIEDQQNFFSSTGDLSNLKLCLILKQSPIKKYVIVEIENSNGNYFEYELVLEVDLLNYCFSIEKSTQNTLLNVYKNKGYVDMYLNGEYTPIIQLNDLIIDESFNEAVYSLLIILFIIIVYGITILFKIKKEQKFGISKK
ncbi:Conserved_hypothetical protein [Hexamita inflata]|uniref:Transmembrane protein n=1 Tax=Hexamita inflata TaxID=28002 RepID=A0AA86R675_9EUKA|nr:Conserved hypothetical protein [Hexamita inflata]